MRKNRMRFFIIIGLSISNSHITRATALFCLHILVFKMSTASNKKVVINKRVKGLSREALEKLSPKELIDKIVQLEAYNFQLRNLLQKKLTDQDKNNEEYALLFSKDMDATVSKEAKMSSRPHQRKFDWSK